MAIPASSAQPVLLSADDAVVVLVDVLPRPGVYIARRGHRIATVIEADDLDRLLDGCGCTTGPAEGVFRIAPRHRTDHRVGAMGRPQWLAAVIDVSGGCVRWRFVGWDGQRREPRLAYVAAGGVGPPKTR
jgi:hypothetical protein